MSAEPIKFSGPSTEGGVMDNSMSAPLLDSMHLKPSEMLKKDDSLYGSLIDEYLPPCILVNMQNDIVHTSGHVSHFLSMPKGKISFNLFKMLSPQLSLVMQTALQRARKENAKVVFHNFNPEDGRENSLLHVTIQPVSNRNESGLIAIFFEVESESDLASTDRDFYRKASPRTRELEKELQLLQTKSQDIIEELESANEELLNYNQELQSSNEQLQAANEELLNVNLELQRKNHELTELNNDMDNFLFSTKIGTLFLDTDMRIRRFTPSATKLFHLINVDIGRPIHHITNQLKYQALFEDIEQVLSTSKTIEREIQSTGNRWYSMRILPYRTMENFIRGTVLTFVDITELKQAGKELEKLSYAIEQSPSMIMIMNIHGTIEYINPAFTKKTGHEIQDVLFRNVKDYLTENTASLSQVTEILHAIQNGKEWSGDLKNRRKQGDEWYWESCSILPIKNKDGEIIHYLKMSEDITEHKKTEELLRKSEMLSAVGELAAGIAHEIRNPLTALKGFVQLMKAQGGNEKYISIMLSEFTRIEHIINELLLLSKPKIINFQPQNLLLILNDVLLLIDTQAIMNQVHILTELEETLPLVNCVENQLKQVFINLLKNAIESMPDGGSICVTMKRLGDQSINIQIRDEGCGIPTDKLQRLGEPFFTTKEKGTGLGMMVSFNIIEGHKGKMLITSQENKGTTISIILPSI
ncbi:PAS domain-containing protein [Paenibacillus sp. GCM10012307]|uniref:histidine kinase n=1 Tax=Paenibacillus roseus TaxID=2798579 RepID=A0A934J653_9BACL|nr:PAS domain-containing protein [Paenibacillus roseus]MBJ6363989.1 PAS domain-containing protein [Paenibacillus roseus]